MPGIYFDEAEVGATIRHTLTRTVTETDNVLFCAITHNPQPLHLDEEYAKKTEFGQRVFNSMYRWRLPAVFRWRTPQWARWWLISVSKR